MKEAFMKKFMTFTLLTLLLSSTVGINAFADSDDNNATNRNSYVRSNTVKDRFGNSYTNLNGDRYRRDSNTVAQRRVERHEEKQERLRARRENKRWNNNRNDNRYYKHN